LGWYITILKTSPSILYFHLFSVRLNGKYVGTGFTHVPGGNDYRNRSVLSYHYYCIILSLVPVPSNDTIPVFDRVLCDDVEGPALFRSVLNDLTQLGGSAFLTEFGGCHGSPTCDEQLDWGLTAADQFFQSWAFWGVIYNDMKTVKRVSRVYARAVAGIPISMQFIASERLFSLSYYVDTTIKQPTEIYIPAIQYPQSSYNVTVNSALQWKVDATNANIILVEPTDQLVNSKEQAVIGVVDIRSNV
jgi:endoglycosylceramidase